jgi:hypothetical protein
MRLFSNTLQSVLYCTRLHVILCFRQFRAPQTLFNIGNKTWGVSILAALDLHNGRVTPGSSVGIATSSSSPLGVVYAVVGREAAWIFLSLISHGWESNRLLSIGIGGGIGWVMLLNV